jgi:RecB family exonuclease
VEPAEIAIAFPDLSLYGQMALDVAQRLGLPLNVGYSLPLSQFPLFLSLQNLLALAQDGFASQSLAAVWDCPYLGRPLARQLGVPQPKGVQNLLKMAGYLDGRETPPGTFLAQAAQRPGLPGQSLEDLAKASQALVDWLGSLGLGGGKLSLAAFAQSASQVLDSLELGKHLLWLDENSQAPWAAARDLASLSALGHELERLGQAADLVGAGPDFSLGRCLQVLRGVLEGRSLRLPGGDPFGVKVLHQAEAAGLKVHTMMLGGLNLGEFPPKPAGQNLLGAAERLALGKASREGLPVWRTDQEEYSGQVLRWLWLIGSARERVVLSTAAAGSDGKPLEPANPLLSLLVRLNEKMPQPAGGVYGDLPELADCLEPGALLGRLAASLLRPGGRDRDLAQAVLHAWSQETGFARRWRAIASRAGLEAGREHLNQVALDQRFPRADEYSGLISHPSARDLLAEIVVRDRFRRWSPSGLEAYMACPLAWFSARLLRVEEIQEPGWGLEPAGEGGWVHLALKKFFDPNEFDPLLPWEDIRARLADCLDQARQELLAAGTPGHPATWQAKQKALLAGLERVVERECDTLGTARPLAVESEMGISLEVSPGWELTLAGRLDRLDLVGQVLQVTDYKHTADQFAMRQAAKQENLAQGYFQLPLYLAAALEHQGPGPSLLKGRLVNTRLPGQNIAQVDLEPDCDLLTRDPSRRDALAREGIANLYNAVRDVYQRVRSGDFVARPQEPICRNCNLGLVCRARPVVEISSGQQ